MDLYIDVNISQMFSPEGAMRYFARLLGVDASSFRPAVSEERPHPFFITSPAVKNAHPFIVINGRPLLTVVPQHMWSHTLADTRSVSLNMPIFFLHEDRVTLGIPLLKVIGRDGATLLGAGDTAPVGNGSTLYIRINWLGYSNWSTQMMTRDQTTAKSTITLAKLAKRFANAVGRFLDEAQQLEGKDPNWRVSTGGGITKEDLILVGVVHRDELPIQYQYAYDFSFLFERQ